MSTFTQIYYHIVFSTKDRVPALTADKRENLFRYTWGILKNKDCHLYRIGGMEDHIHILTSLHSTVALADLVKDIKVSTSAWIKDNGVFSKFTHWQDGYGAFTVSHDDKDAVIEYIKGQPEHHKKVSFGDELVGCWSNSGLNSMKNTWFEPLRDCPALSGPACMPTVFRWLHPRLITLFAFGEPMRIRVASPLCLTGCHPSSLFRSASSR